MKFAFILIVVGAVCCSVQETVPDRTRDVLSEETFVGRNYSRKTFWLQDDHGKIIQRPFKYRPIYENVRTALFPHREQPFPPGGQSILASPGSQSFDVGSSIDFPKDGTKITSSDPGKFHSPEITFSTYSNLNDQKFNSFGESVLSGTSPSGMSGESGVFSGVSSLDELGNVNNIGSIGPNAIGSAFYDRPPLTIQSFYGYPHKYSTELAKNPLFLVLKLLVTDPGLWVSSPVLYHGLTRTGIVRPFSQGFGVYGYRFPNSVPESQVFGSSNILNIRA